MCSLVEDHTGRVGELANWSPPRAGWTEQPESSSAGAGAGWRFKSTNLVSQTRLTFQISDPVNGSSYQLARSIPGRGPCAGPQQQPDSGEFEPDGGEPSHPACTRTNRRRDWTRNRHQPMLSATQTTHTVLDTTSTKANHLPSAQTTSRSLILLTDNSAGTPHASLPSASSCACDQARHPEQTDHSVSSASQSPRSTRQPSPSTA